VIVAAVSEALGVGEALPVGVADAVGVGDGFASEFELFPFAQTINPRRIIPTTTANITRPEAPGFFSDAGVNPALAEATGGVVAVTKAGAGVDTISTRALL